MTPLLLFVVAVVTVFITYIKLRYQYWSNNNLPVLRKPSIPFGNLQRPSQRTCSIGFHIKNLYDEAKQKGLKHCGLYFFFSPVYLVIDLDYLKNVVTKDFQHFVDRGMYYNEKKDPISAHLFAIGGSRWKNLRTKLSPTFTSGKMKMMFPTVVECVGLLLESIERKTSEIDIKEVLGRFTTDVIGSCAFGIDCNSIKEEDSPFRVYGKKVFTSTRMRTLKMMIVTNFPTLGRLLGVRQVSKEVSDFFTAIVKDTIEYREKNNFSRPDFLQLLIDLKNEEDGYTLSIDEVVAQSFIFFLAGFETSSTTMTFTLYELAKNEEIQERLRQEIIKVLGKYHGEITYEAINDMKYLNQVIDESLRKYPPVPFVTRTCVKDYKVPDENVTIEKGRRVIIPILGLHYDAEYFPEPDKFDPDRFSDENKQLRRQYAYIPFGEGPRICIGMRFGLTQTKVGLVALLRQYKFSINKRTRDPLKMASNSFILNAEDGIWLDSQKI